MSSRRKQSSSRKKPSMSENENLPSCSVSVKKMDELINIEDKPADDTTVEVDCDFPNKDSFHVYSLDKRIFSATLNQTNMQNNNNKFYIIQLLKKNNCDEYSVWCRWGRVGHHGQSSTNNCGSNFHQARDVFKKKFYEKTRNSWDDTENFVHVKGKYDLVHIEHRTESIEVKKVAEMEVESKLCSNLLSLLKLICDQKKMEDVMKDMAYDSNRSPLGKLTLKQLKEGYVALNKIADVLTAGGVKSDLMTACNEFYTKIPHNFGMKVPPLIQTQEDIDNKLQMLEALSNIYVAMSVMNTKSNIKEHPLDNCYRHLNCSLEMIKPSSCEFIEIDKYLKETHGSTHANYNLEIIDAFKCFKESEQSNFIDYKNNLLLWHGSRITNWFGILKQGLRIAPPEAPCTGYMFGKGVYFADASSKSANYCHASRNGNEGILLLCEVSLGNQLNMKDANSSLPSGLASYFKSVKGLGQFVPSGFKSNVLSSDAKVPFGPLIKDGSDQQLYYNEYIVYDVNQIKMKYLLRVKFNYKY